MNDTAYKGPRDPINAPCNAPKPPQHPDKVIQTAWRRWQRRRSDDPKDGKPRRPSPATLRKIRGGVAVLLGLLSIGLMFGQRPDAPKQYVFTIVDYTMQIDGFGGSDVWNCPPGVHPPSNDCEHHDIHQQDFCHPWRYTFDSGVFIVRCDNQTHRWPRDIYVETDNPTRYRYVGTATPTVRLGLGRCNDRYNVSVSLDAHINPCPWPLCPQDYHVSACPDDPTGAHHGYRCCHDANADHNAAECFTAWYPTCGCYSTTCCFFNPQWGWVCEMADVVWTNDPQWGWHSETVDPRLDNNGQRMLELMWEINARGVVVFDHDGNMLK